MNKTLSVVVILMLVLFLSSCGERQLIPADLRQQVSISPFIFSGTVKLLNTSTIDADDVQDLMVVQIDQIFDTIDEFKHLEGELITVQTDKIQNYRENQKRVFITNRWIIGESVAMINLGDIDFVDEKNTAKLKNEISNIRKTWQRDRLKEQIEKAEMVFIAEVADIQNLKKTDDKESEHDPEWAIAVLNIKQRLKDTKEDQTKITVLFSTSMDVMWFAAPKLKVGDSGAWLLSKKGKEFNIDEKHNDLYVVYRTQEFIKDEKNIEQLRNILGK